MWSRLLLVTKRPVVTTRRKRLSVATSHRTVTFPPLPEPGVACGVGVTRVHSTTASGSGSPEATPCWKTGCFAFDPPLSFLPRRAPAGPVDRTPIVTAVPTAPVARTVRRGRGAFDWFSFTPAQTPPGHAGDGTFRAFTDRWGGCRRGRWSPQMRGLPSYRRRGVGRPKNFATVGATSTVRAWAEETLPASTAGCPPPMKNGIARVAG